MTRINTLLSARNLTDLVTAANAYLAPLLNHKFEQCVYSVVDEAGFNGQEYTLALQLEDTGVAQTDPYILEQFGGDNAVETMQNFVAFVAANPGLFISQPRYWPFVTERRRNRLYPLVSVSCVDATNGTTNWLADTGTGAGGGGGGSPTGPASGDLSGTYPGPNVFSGQASVTPGAGVATTLDSAAVASIKSIAWEVEAIKGTTTYTSVIQGNNDGTTGNFTEGDIALSPPSGGTFDFTYDVDVSGGSMRLRVTPVTGGWTFRSRRMAPLAA